MEEALWFAESFGLIPQYLSLNTDTDEEIVLPLSDAAKSITPPTATKPEISDDTMRQTLYLLERFGVSDQFYHELSITYPCLARSYKIKQLRKDVGSEVDIVCLDQPYDGAYRTFNSLLLETIKREVSLV